VLCLLLASLAVTTAMTESTIADLLLYALGTLATIYVLYLLARGRA
jgi:hypothetical protein